MQQIIRKSKKNICILLIFIFLFSNCSQKTSIDKSILSVDEFTQVLIDMHRADGIIRTADLDKKLDIQDSTSLYNYVYIKHKINRYQFNATLKYYTENLDEYIKIYDIIIDSLTKEKTIAARVEETEKKEKKQAGNLWDQKMHWELPADGELSVIPFTINNLPTGTYLLSAKITLYPDDLSVSQRMTIGVLYEDGTMDINNNGIIPKNGQSGVVTVQITTDSKKKPKSILGRILDHSEGTGKKHASVSDIELKLLKNPEIED